jgi:hypothetical protein
MKQKAQESSDQALDEMWAVDVQWKRVTETGISNLVQASWTGISSFQNHSTITCAVFTFPTHLLGVILTSGKETKKPMPCIFP